MVTIASVSADRGSPCAIRGVSQQELPRGNVIGQNLHRHHQGPRGRLTSPSRFGRRLHLHHQHHLEGPCSLAHQHGQGNLSPGGRRHHGFRGRRGSRGSQDFAVREHGPHFRRMHRSLSPHGKMHHRFSDGSPGSPHRGNRGHRGHCAGLPCNGNFRSVSFRKHHLHNLHSQDLNSGSDSDRFSPPLAKIDQGIERLGVIIEGLNLEGSNAFTNT